MIGYTPGPGPLRRAHPFTPLTIAGASAVLVFALPAPWGPLAVLLAVISTALFERVPGALRSAATVALPFWIFLTLIHSVIRADPEAALVFAARITSIIVAFVLAIATVHPGRLVEALIARGVPFAPTFLFASTLQIVPRLRERARTILDAQRCRGLRLRGSLAGRAKAIVPLAVPLVLSSLAEVDERAVALEARGAGAAKRRTPLEPPRDSVLDRSVRYFLTVLVLVALMVRIL